MIKSTRPEMAPYEEYIEEIKSIWQEGLLTNNGPKVKLFKSKIVEYMKCGSAELFVNGHSALLIALKLLNLPQGGEVLTSPFTFVSTTNAIVQSGLTPVFCDIDDTYNISIESIERNITDKTCAIVTPHIFGIPCHVKDIEKIAKKNNIKVLFDGAQAFGTKVDGVNIANFGDITMFSLHAIKVFNAIEGGVLAYHDRTYSRQIELYRNFGVEYGEKNDVLVSGINAKMTEFSAAMGIINLRYVDEVRKKRERLARYYIERFDEIQGLNTFQYNKNTEYNFAYFPVRIDAKRFNMSRDELYKYLFSRGIQTRKLYDTLTCDYRLYKDENYRRDIRYAREVSETTLDFPMYSELSFEDIDEIAIAIRNR